MSKIGFHTVPSHDPHGVRDWGEVHWRTLAKALIDDGHTIFLIGSKGDKPKYDHFYREMTSDHLVHIVDCVGETKVIELPSFLMSLDAVVVVNSFIMHMAVEYDVPTVAIVGGTRAEIILPYKRNVVVYEDKALLFHYPKAHVPVENPRIGDIHPLEVYLSVLDLLEKYAGRD